MKNIDLILFVLLCGVLYACTAPLLEAMDYETQHQRQIAHGFHEYQQFVRANP